MSNAQELLKLTKEITGKPSQTIAVPLLLIKYVSAISGRNATSKAVFLAQLIYWSDKGKRKDGFIFKTRSQWTEEVGLSADQLEAYTKEFVKLGLIETKVKKAKGAPTLHYKFSKAKFTSGYKEFLLNAIGDKTQTKLGVTPESITEITA